MSAITGQNNGLGHGPVRDDPAIRKLEDAMAADLRSSSETCSISTVGFTSPRASSSSSGDDRIWDMGAAGRGRG